MTKCCWQDCEQDADCVPEVNVPATGRAIGTHDPLSCIVDVPVCDDHFADISVKELLTRGGPTGEGLAPVFIASARGAGGPPPDFASAWLARIPLHSAKYQQFSKQRDKHKAAQQASKLRQN